MKTPPSFSSASTSPVTPSEGTSDTSLQTASSGHVQLCSDGKYRWIYELNMLTNPAILITVVRIFGYIFLGIWAIMMVINILDGFDLEQMWGNTKMIIIFMGGFSVLIIIGYLIVAARNGWKYIVLFEMDEEGVLHRQLKEQVKRAKAIGWLTMMAGAASGNITTIGVGINSMTKEQSYSSFANVRSVKSKRCYNTIKVNELLEKNQVYVKKRDFDFVLNFILSHCPKVKK